TVLGSFLGTAVFGLTGLGVLLCLGAYPEALDEELPMLAVAQGLGDLPGGIYGGLLFFAMLGAALSCLGASFLYLKEKTHIRKGLLLTLPLALLAFGCSTLGFGNLIATVYPIFGYLGLAAVGSMVLHAVLLSVTKGDL
ncbi:MAG: hypothetical protein MJ078_04980, partial [Clostridia bacterium]|nr:hypothetical protein [Clostridia bacterium]